MTLIEIELLCINVFLIILCMLHIEHVKTGIKKAYKTLKAAGNRILLGTVFHFNRLFPRKKDLVVFGADNGDGFAGNPKYLFLEAIKHPEIHCVWVTKNNGVYNTMKELGYEVYMFNSREGKKMQRKAATLIHSHSIKEDFNYLLVGGATSVNTWHGVGLKRSWWRNKNSFSGKWMLASPSLKRKWHMWWALTNMPRQTYVIGTSEEVNDYYPATYNVDADHVLCLGQARNDIFFDDALEDSAIPAFFRNEKVIVYMPTHRNYGGKKGKIEHIGQGIDYERLSEVLQKYGYTFVIKQHRWNTKSKALRNQYPNIVDISAQNYNIDTQLLLKYTDILITDYSSVYTDFLLLDRPVVFYCYDKDAYLNKWELNFDYDYVTPGPKVFDSDELIDALEKLMQGRDEYEAERQRVKRVFYSPENQGPVAKKQMDYIIEHIIGRKK